MMSPDSGIEKIKTVRAALGATIELNVPMFIPYARSLNSFKR